MLGALQCRVTEADWRKLGRSGCVSLFGTGNRVACCSLMYTILGHGEFVDRLLRWSRMLVGGAPGVAQEQCTGSCCKPARTASPSCSVIVRLCTHPSTEFTWLHNTTARKSTNATGTARIIIRTPSLAIVPQSAVPFVHSQQNDVTSPFFCASYSHGLHQQPQRRPSHHL